MAPETSHHPTLTFRLLFGVIVTLAACARIYHLDAESLFMDELRQISFYNSSFSDIIRLAASMQQPPLDVWIGRIFHSFLPGDFGARLPSALFGTASVALLMLVVSRISGRPWALISGLILALLPFHLYYSQEARPYAITIFFLLLWLWLFTRIIQLHHPGRSQYILLFITSCGFLYSRTLAPLVVVICLIALLLVQFLVQRIREGSFAAAFRHDPGRQFVYVMLILLLATLLYLPGFAFILKMGTRFVPDGGQIGIGVLLHGISRFSLLPMWQAWLVQMEPFGYAFAALYLAALVLLFRSQPWRANPLLVTVILLIPAAMTLHAFVFLAKTTNPLRPPYPVYILPLALIASMHSLRELVLQINTGRMKIVYAASLLVIVGILIVSANRYYQTPHKTDWRGLTQYLARNTNPNTVLLADAFSNHKDFPVRDWEPGFYGFPHYYRGKTARIELWRLPLIKPEILDSKVFDPVLIIFEWRDYLLTPGSPYPIISKGDRIQPDFKQLTSDKTIEVIHFTGFTVLRSRPTPSSASSLTASPATFSQKLLQLLEKLDPVLPNSSSSADIVRASLFLKGRTSQ